MDHANLRRSPPAQVLFFSRYIGVLPPGEAAMDTTMIGTVWGPRVLSVLRMIAGLILLQYGLAKLFGWPAVKIFENLPWLSLYGVAGMFELIGGILLILGLFTRPVAFILSGEMAAAYFIDHFPRGFFPLLNHGELAVILCFTFLYLAFAGAGPWSLDALRRKV
jgi:putative oxidoreductase